MTGYGGESEVRRKSVLVRVVLVVLSTLMALGLTAVAVRSSDAQESAGNDQIGLEDLDSDAGWYISQTAPEYPLKDSLTYLKQGKVVRGRCQFSGVERPPADGDSIEERALAINNLTCQAFVERGIPPADAYATELLQEGEEELSNTQDSVTNDDEASAEGGFTTAATKRHARGFLKTWWEDPARIRVNSVRNSTNWHYNGNCVVPRVSGSYTYKWYGRSGWKLGYNDWLNSYTCNQSNSSSYVHYYNDAFCDMFTGEPQPRTNVRYSRNSVHGRYNGNFRWKYWTDATGGCDFLLHYRGAFYKWGVTRLN